MSTGKQIKEARAGQKCANKAGTERGVWGVFWSLEYDRARCCQRAQTVSEGRESACRVFLQGKSDARQHGRRRRENKEQQKKTWEGGCISAGSKVGRSFCKYIDCNDTSEDPDCQRPENVQGPGPSVSELSGLA